MTQSPSAFLFETEFTPAGRSPVVGPRPQVFLARRDRRDGRQGARRGRSQGAPGVEAKGFASVDRIVVVNLAPVAAQLAGIAEQLRAEAAELAMIAAKKIAGTALDKATARKPPPTPSPTSSPAQAQPHRHRRRRRPNRSPMSNAAWNSCAAKGVGASIAFVPEPERKAGRLGGGVGRRLRGLQPRRRRRPPSTPSSMPACRTPSLPQLELFSARRTS